MLSQRPPFARALSLHGHSLDRLVFSMFVESAVWGEWQGLHEAAWMLVSGRMGGNLSLAREVYAYVASHGSPLGVRAVGWLGWLVTLLMTQLGVSVPARDPVLERRHEAVGGAPGAVRQSMLVRRLPSEDLLLALLVVVLAVVAWVRARRHTPAMNGRTDE